MDKDLANPFCYQRMGDQEYLMSAPTRSGAILQQIHDRFVEGKGRIYVGTLGLPVDEMEEMEFGPEYPPPKLKRDFLRISKSNTALGNTVLRDTILSTSVSRDAAFGGRTAGNILDEIYEANGENEIKPNEKASRAVISLPRKPRAIAKPVTTPNSNNPAPAKPVLQSSLNRNKMAGGGFQGSSRGGVGGLKGANWTIDPDIKLESKPSELFPAHPNLKRPDSPTEKEKRQIKHFKNLQNRIHRGPLYTKPTKRDPDAPAKTFSEDQFNRQYGSNRKADMDPFTGVETYSQRMAIKTNEIPKLSSRPFDKNLFPEELWSTLEGEEGEEVRKHINRAMEKKAQSLKGTNTKDADARTKTMLEKIHNLGGDEDAEDPDDEMNDEVEQDSEFGDSEMGGDYDGEQYFDNGEEGSEAGDGGADEEY